MTLTNRLLSFFLATLGVVLVGFSAILLVLAHAWLHRQSEQRLEATLNTLSAATEVGAEGVEWEPQERRLVIPWTPDEQVAWQITNHAGRVVDRSEPPLPAGLLAAEAKSPTLDPSASPDPAPPGDLWPEWQGQQWRLRSLVLTPTSHAAPIEDPEAQHRQLTILAGVRVDPVWRAERNLAGLLCLLSAGVWLAALLTGRAICQRALAPVTRMADAARGMGAADLAQRLPVPASHDELADLGRAFNTLLERVQASLERQQSFAGDASHQLRTPLTVILGQVDVALRRERTGDEYRTTLLTVRKRAERLQAIVEALLFLARAGADTPPLATQPIELARWLPQHLATWSEHPRVHDLRLEPVDDGLTVAASPVLLGETLNILLENACGYSQAGTPVTLRVARHEDGICLEVEDQGSGISPDELSQLFTPFYRSPQAREQGLPGTGLGLSIAARMVQSLGGRIDVSSRLHEGSCFRITLPSASDG